MVAKAKPIKQHLRAIAFVCFIAISFTCLTRWIIIPPKSTPYIYGLNVLKIKMPLKIVEATISNFSDVFNKFRGETSNYKANLILFLADKDPSTSLSWCPDCVTAEPIIYKKLEESGEDVALLRAYVGDRPTWRNPQNPLRVDPRFKLKGVPTLVRWENDTVAARLEDYEAHVESKIMSLLNPQSTK